MRVITCTSYYGTGSSAVTDYVTEFETVKSLGEYEIRILHDMDGVTDLQYHLTENHNRHNSGHAIKRFKKLVDFYAGNRLASRYEPFFQNRWREISYKYINSLVDFSYRGWWQYDLLDKGEKYYYYKMMLNKFYKLTIGRNNSHVLNVLPKEITYCGHPTKEAFLEKTRNYVAELMEAANPENAPMLMVDQLVPSSEIWRYLPFFDDIKVIVVERDPRDLYILEKYQWQCRIIPTDDVETFCKWYKYTRAHRKTEVFNPEKVKLIQFEDLIYRYDETTTDLCNFLGLNEKDHKFPKRHLDPSKSIENTQLWKRYDIGSNLKFIEHELAEYLYDYDTVLGGAK